MRGRTTVRSLALLPFGLIMACAPAARAPSTAQEAAPPKAVQLVVPPEPSSVAAKPDVRGLVRAAPVAPPGCTVSSSRWAKVALRFTPEGQPFYSGAIDSRSIVLGTDGSMFTTVGLMYGALRLRGYLARSEVELYTTSTVLFGGMVDSRGPLRWARTAESGKVTALIALPDGVTLDDGGTASGELGCGDVLLEGVRRPSLERPYFWVSGPLSSGPSTPPRLLGVRGLGKVVGSQGAMVHVVVELGEIRLYGWTARRNVTEPSVGIGHGYGTGYGHSAGGYSGGPNAIACPTSFAVYKELADGSIGEVGTFGGGAAFLVDTTAHPKEGWTRVRLGPDSDEAHDLGWLVPARTLLPCDASAVRRSGYSF